MAKEEAVIDLTCEPCNGSDGEWACSLCDRRCSSHSLLKGHEAREHGIMRAARYRVDSNHCTVCMRYFHNRSRLLKHLHDQRSEICLINTLLTLPVRSADDIEDDNRRQWELEADARKHRERIDYAEQVFEKAFGPSRKLPVPLDVCRVSRSPGFDMALKCGI